MVAEQTCRPRGSQSRLIDWIHGQNSKACNVRESLVGFFAGFRMIFPCSLLRTSLGFMEQACMALCS